VTEVTADGLPYVVDLRAAASLLIRQHLALEDEGIGPRPELDGDPALLAWAVHLAGSGFDDHDLWDAHVVPGSVHVPRCARNYPHNLQDLVDDDGGEVARLLRGMAEAEKRS
jgi:hypothetical protein